METSNTISTRKKITRERFIWLAQSRLISDKRMKIVFDLLLNNDFVKKHSNGKYLYHGYEDELLKILSQNDIMLPDKLKVLEENWDVNIPGDQQRESATADWRGREYGVIHYFDEDYPVFLREINDPPQILYYLGNKELLNRTKLSIVGTRNYIHGARSEVDRVVEFCYAHNVVTVSGLAYGIDSMVHSLSIKHNVPTIAVVASSVRHVLPSGNRHLANRILEAGGLIISQTRTNKDFGVYLYPLRNRIIAGLSRALVVVQAPGDSGALITARCAYENNRAVYVSLFSPYSLRLKGNYGLLDDDKAKPLTITNASLETELGLNPGANHIAFERAKLFREKMEELDEIERKVVELIWDGIDNVQHLRDEINCIKLDQDFDLNVILAKLMIAGFILKDKFGRLNVEI